MSKPISASYLERKLRAIVGNLGGNPLPDLDDVIQGLLVLENDRPEWARSGGEVFATGGAMLIPGAANTTTAQLRNPQLSGVLIIVERVQVSLAIAAVVRTWEAFSVVDFATSFVANTVNRDLRQLQTVGDSVAGIVSGVAQVAPGGSGRQFGQLHVPAGDLRDIWPGPTMLPPGTSIMLDEGVLNNPANYIFSWRERPIEGAFDIR